MPKTGFRANSIMVVEERCYYGLAAALGNITCLSSLIECFPAIRVMLWCLALLCVYV